MRKSLVFSVISLLSLCSFSFAEGPKVREFLGHGEVVTVDSVYSQITIKHDSIKDFSEADQTVFSVSDRALLKGLSRGDLVKFQITDTKGDVQISSLLKTGVASHEDDRLPVGKALQSVLEGTGEMVKGVTTPIAPVHEVAGGVVDATTGATGSALGDASTESKTKF